MPSQGAADTPCSMPVATAQTPFAVVHCRLPSSVRLSTTQVIQVIS